MSVRCARVVVEGPDGPAERVLRIAPEATVADLLAEVAPRSTATGAEVDGRWLPASADLSPVRSGVTVLATEPRPVPPPAPCVVEVVGGLRAGASHRVAPGRHVLGRRGDIMVADPTVSRRHLELDVAPDGSVVAEDLRSTNGVSSGTDGGWVSEARPVDGQALHLGATTVRVRRPVRDRVDGPFHRPPRIGTPGGEALVAAPDGPGSGGPVVPFSWAGVLAPLAVGIVLAVVWSPFFAVFAALSPVVGVATWVEGRRRRLGRGRRARRRFVASLAAFDDALQRAVTAERAARQAAAPDPAEVVRRAIEQSTRLWERRPGHADFLHLSVGTADLAWDPTIGGEVDAPEVMARIDQHATLPAVPVVVGLGSGRVVGLAGPRPATLAVARSLVVQAAVLHGPADLAIACPAGPLEWDWARWLPHVDVRDTAPKHLVVVDGTAAAVPDGASAVAVAPTVAELPAACDTVVVVHDRHGRATVTTTATGARLTDVRADGVDGATAAAAARALAGIDDPDSAAGGLPAEVSWTSLVGTQTPETIGSAWSDSLGMHTLSATVGVDTDGPVTIDLVADGPHALVAGTTGSGKSELLRTWVAAMAAAVDPRRLGFVLIDFKGGSAFDGCEELPHVTGVVTDLDDHMAARALTCLEAEVRRRERVLRDAACPDLRAYEADGGASGPDPLPHLVVVVDEFAALAAEIPDFVPALVAIAQRGRSLGLHLVLATQRPAGAVTDDIRANANLRVCLRVAEAGDSTDIVGRPDAARFGRHTAGRALLRLGAEAVRPLQVATLDGQPVSDDRRPVEVIDDESSPLTSDRGTALAEVTAAVAEAHRSAGGWTAACPWPRPLAPVVALADVPVAADPGQIVLGVLDDPSRQRQPPFAWRPSAGNLLLVGGPGSGAADTLVTVAVAAAGAAVPTHVYALDFGAGGLRAIGGMDAVGGVVRAAEPERVARLVRHMAETVRVRRAGVTGPRTLVLVDGIGAFVAAHTDLAGLALVDDLVFVATEGPAVGVSVALATDRAAGVPAAVAAVTAQRLVFRLPDALDGAALGVARAPGPGAPAGRAVAAEGGHEVQIASADPQRVTGRRAGAHPPPIAVLRTDVRADEIGIAAHHGDHLCIPVGIGDVRLEPVSLVLPAGANALVTGPARSGRSTTLVTLARAVRHAGLDVRVVGVTPSGSRLARRVDVVVHPGDGAAAGAEDAVAAGARLVLVDDAERTGDVAFSRMVDDSKVNVVAAGRPDRIRSRYGHWAVDAGRDGFGIALRPDPDLDGALLHAVLPRRSPKMPPGRGYLVADGEVELIQVASP